MSIVEYKKIKNTGLGVLFILLFFLIPVFSTAQIPSLDMSLILKSAPLHPKPNKVVTVTLTSYSTNLDKAESIKWYVNGNLVAQDASISAISLKTGALGSRSTIEVVVKSSRGEVLRKQLILRPTDIDLLWEAQSYTHPLYKGKALPSSRASVTTVAMAYFVTSGGRLLSSNELIYKWRQNGKILGSVSGRGKNTLTTEAPRLFNSELIHVEIESADGLLRGSEAIEIESVQPRIIFYEKNPILGTIYEQALQGVFRLSNKEVTITAIPFFFSGKEKADSDLIYEWRFNGSIIDNPSRHQSNITLRNIGDGSGNATVFLSVQNAKKILQAARGSFSIQFTETGASNPFSF